ncbi:MAG TPA: hypothetical protein VEV62_11910, partial [Parafilimonas sp.]|nr:hypothetical protein [Parafilimonas sp.]
QLLYSCQIINMPIAFKAETVISYLRDHSLKNEWISANPEVVKFLLSGSFVMVHMESLFNYCRLKPDYRQSFESYIKTILS